MSLSVENVIGEISVEPVAFNQIIENSVSAFVQDEFEISYVFSSIEKIENLNFVKLKSIKAKSLSISIDPFQKKLSSERKIINLAKALADSSYYIKNCTDIASHQSVIEVKIYKKNTVQLISSTFLLLDDDFLQEINQIQPSEKVKLSAKFFLPEFKASNQSYEIVHLLDDRGKCYQLNFCEKKKYYVIEKELDMDMKEKLNLSLCIGEIELTAKELFSLKKGSIIELPFNEQISGTLKLGSSTWADVLVSVDDVEGIQIDVCQVS